MTDALIDFYDIISSIDLIYLILTILSLIKCYKKGFVLSILSMAKWLLAYIITLIIFPRAKPYLKDIIDNEYVLDVGLGISHATSVFMKRSKPKQKPISRDKIVLTRTNPTRLVFFNVCFD